MKIIKRVISLVMSVIMLFTGTPMLQASDLALDRAQMVKLQEEILLEVDDDVTSTLNKNDQSKNLEELIQRYGETEKSPLEVIEIINQTVKEVDIDTLKETVSEIQKIREEAKEIAKTEERYQKILDEREREQVAFFTRLFHSKWLWGPLVTILGVFFIILPFTIDYTVTASRAAYGVSEISEMLCGSIGSLFSWAIGLAAFLAGTAIMVAGDKETPVIPGFSTDDEAITMFVERPFEMLNKFKEQDFKMMYERRDPICAQLLEDTVYIAHYLSTKDYNSIRFQDSRYAMFTKTIYWYDMSSEDRVIYLHKWAERLRAAARAGAKDKFNNLRIGLEER